VKLPTSRAAIFGSLLCGATVGAAFGLPFGWVATQLALMGVVWLLQSTASQPRRAAGLAAAFSFGLVISGFSGFIFGLPEGLLAWALVPWIGYSLVFSVGTAMLAWCICRLPLGSMWRWNLVWPAAWTLFEWTIGQGSMGMPWLRLGHTHAPNGPLAAFLPVGGVLVVSALMWVVAALSLLALQARRRLHSLRTAIAVSAVIAVVGALKLVNWTDEVTAMKVALLQPGDDGNAPVSGHRALVHWFDHYRGLALNSNAQLVVTPQLALPNSVQAIPEVQWKLLAEELSQRDQNMLIGVSDKAPSDRLYNATLALGVSGFQQYQKQQLFPFGEFIPALFTTAPLRAWIDRFMGAIIPDREAGPADQPSLKLAEQRAAVMICFEVAFANLWRERAATASVLIQMAGDDSVTSGMLSRQFRQLSQARALEFSKPMLRTSHTHGTYAIDHRGQIIGAFAPNQRGALEISIVPRHGLTPYARFGDALALTLATLAFAAAALSRARSVRSTSGLAPERCPYAAGLARTPLSQSQSGQVMVPAIVLLLISAGLFYLMVNSSQAVNEKVRVTNAADAAAYSAGVAEARALNFYAYTNRALIANQMVIAQMVSFTSWIRYFGHATDRITDPQVAAEMVYMLWPSPEALTTAAVFTATRAALAYGGMSGEQLAQHVATAAGTATSLHEAASRWLSASQRLVAVDFLLDERQRRIATAVVQAMDAGLEAEVVHADGLPGRFNRFTHRYGRDTGQGGADERGRLADVVTRSRDEFTRERNWSINSPFDINRWLPGGRQNGALKKRAGTELVGYDEWRAMDTLEMHGQHVCWRRGTPRWCSDIQLPVGWGAANVDSGGTNGQRGYHGNAYGENPRTANLAEGEMLRVPSTVPYSGIPASQDLANLDASAELSTGITILVSKSHGSTLTSGGAAQARPSGQLALFSNGQAGGRMAALSRAQVFFDRIEPRSDSRAELASLYNPYWRVRLVAPRLQDRFWASDRQGGLQLP
jgi:apolipoprotein N-acyltransferase